MSENKLDLIFKAYDIRGIFGDTLTPEIAYKIGFAYADFLDSEKIIIGHDGRVSNKDMLNAVASGIKKNNKSILYVGTVPTDVVYSLSGIQNLPGVVITASHNPKEWTGLKLCNKGATPIGIETGLLDIKEKVKNLNIDIDIDTDFKAEDIVELYIEHLNSIIKPVDINNSINFIIDAGNGALGSVIEEIESCYNLNFDKLYFDIDGNFPNHPADPSDSANLQELKELVISRNKEFGVAFDGDADRAVFLDNKGNLISGSLMTALVSDWLNEKKDNLKIVHNVNVSPSVVNYLEKKGITTIRSKVGHSYIKQIMREEDADFGGEHSAHFYLKENYYADSGIVTLLIFLQMLSEKNVKVSEIIDSYNFPPSSGEINFEVKNVDESLEKVEKYFENSFDKLDGLSYFADNYWFNLRGSNTEPKLRLNAEAKDEETLNNLINEISNIIKV
ncbi:MAG: phosphomannomutase/phosphoglucomutase [Candidatus Actinomarina sp.]